MTNEKVREFLKYVKTNPEAQEKLSGLPKPEGEEAIIQWYAQAAKLLGYDVTESDLRGLLAEQEKERTSRTDDAAKKIETLPDDEVDQVAGGGYGGTSKPNCHDTYLDRENCWFDDACDQNINLYKDYLCHSNYYGSVCGDKATFDCSKFIF